LSASLLFNLAIFLLILGLLSTFQCLCLAPTYELALQIGGVTEKMAKNMTNVRIGYAVKGERGE